MFDIIIHTNSVKSVAFDRFICFLINLVDLIDYLLVDFRISWIGELTAIISQDSMDSEGDILD